MKNNLLLFHSNLQKTIEIQTYFYDLGLNQIQFKLKIGLIDYCNDTKVFVIRKTFENDLCHSKIDSFFKHISLPDVLSKI